MRRIVMGSLCALPLAFAAPSWAQTETVNILSVVKTAEPNVALYDLVPIGNNGVQSGKLAIGGRTHQDLWVMQGKKRSSLTLDFGSESPWSTFKMILGTFAPYPDYTGPVAIEVFGDGRRLYGQSFTTALAAVPLEVDVTKVRTVTITLDPVCATEHTKNPYALSAYFAEASFERSPAVSPAPALAPAPVRCRTPLLVQDTPFSPPPEAPVRALW